MYVDATASFRPKMRIEKVGGNRIRAALSSLRQLSLGEEKKMRFRGGGVVFYRFKIRSKAANVAKIDVEKFRGGIKKPGVNIKRLFRPGDIFGPLPR